MSDMAYTKDMFEKVKRESYHADEINRPTIKYWADVWRRLKMNKLAMTGLAILIIMGIMSIIGPHLSGFNYYEQDLFQKNIRPNSTYWFGTDELGRDLFSRAWLGTRYSLLIGIAAAFIDFGMGVLYGGIAGIASRKVDAVMMRIAEIIYSIPYMLVVILISVVFSTAGSGTSMFVLVFAMTITGWVPMANLVRGQVLQLKEYEYSLASESLGASKSWILRKHIIPNSFGPILVNLTLTIPRAIFAEATLSFMGLGLQLPKPSLGTLANDGLAVMPIGLFYQIMIPSILISLIMFSFNVLGDGLRDALDPRLRK
jgi:dipeptide transport system permease protein